MTLEPSLKQHGAVLPLVALALFVLLGMAGLVIDLSALFVAKTELQSALDSCSLAAAQELDGAADALARATNAGLQAGNANQVVFQQRQAGIVAADVTFSDALNGSYSSSFVPVANARYAKCTHATLAIPAYLIPLVGAASSHSVAAVAVATRTHAQASCPVPIGLIPKTSATAPNYGYQIGEWVPMLYNNNGTAPTPGEMGWYNLNGTTSASETKAEMANGYCNSRVGDNVGTPGAKVSIDQLWNARFGIYMQSPQCTINVCPPDFTGYAYTSKNWTNAVPQNAYSGTPAAGSDPTAANFLTKRANYNNYGNTDNSINTGNAITGLNVKGGYKTVATWGSPTGQHYTTGLNRRVVLVPVVASSKIADYACMLMLTPVDGPTATIQFEYLGNGGNINSPCIGNGLAGGASGPLVPVLVQ